jgi:hypothetical protein
MSLIFFQSIKTKIEKEDDDGILTFIIGAFSSSYESASDLKFSSLCVSLSRSSSIQHIFNGTDFCLKEMR